MRINPKKSREHRRGFDQGAALAYDNAATALENLWAVILATLVKQLRVNAKTCRKRNGVLKTRK